MAYVDLKSLFSKARAYSKTLDERDRQQYAQWQADYEAQQRAKLPYRPQAIDERAFGVSRPVLEPPAVTRRPTVVREWQGPLTQGQLIEQATKGFADFNQRYDDAAQNYREAARRETAMLDPYDPLSVQRAGTDAAAADRAAVQNEWYQVAQDALWKIGPEGRAKLEQLVKDDAAWKEANPFGGYRDNSLRNELEELYGKELVENLTEYIRQVGNADVMAQRKQEAQSLGKESGAAAAATVLTRPVSGIEGTAGMLAQKGERLFSGSRAPLDWNDPSQTGTNVTGAVREGATSELGPVGKFLANTAFSIADSAAAAALGPYGAPLLATAAANASMQEAKARGASDDQAIALGLISGVAEAVTEKVSIDHLFSLKSPDSVKDILMNGLKQAVPEMSEEAASSVINLLADEVIMGKQSRYQEMIRNGMTSGEALIELAKEVGLDSLAGALSGFVTGSGRSAGVYGMETVTGERQARRAASVSQMDTEEAVADAPEAPPLSREEQIVSAMTQGLWQPASGADTYVGGVAQEFKQTYEFGDLVVDKQTGKRYEVVQQRENGGVIALDADNKADGTYHSFAADRIMPYEAREASDFDYSAPLFLAKPEYKSAVEMVDSGQRGEYHGSWTGGLHAVQLLDENGKPDRKVFVEREAFYAPGDVPAGDFRAFVAPRNQTVANPATVEEGARPEAATPVGQTAVQPVQEAAPEEEAQRLTIPKSAYVGSPALQKLGIKVDGAVLPATNSAKLRQNEADRFHAKRNLENTKKRLKPTAEELQIAQSAADGTVPLSRYGAGEFNRGRIEQLVDAIKAVNAVSSDLIENRKWQVRDALSDLTNKVLAPAVEKGRPRLKGALAGLTKTVMVERQTERLMKQIFGGENGQRVYDELFRPIGVNRAEAVRFKDAQMNRVREFADSTGKTRALTRPERAVAQALLERRTVLTELQAIPEQQQALVKNAAAAVNDGKAFNDVAKKMGFSGTSRKAEKLQGLVQAYSDYMDVLATAQKMDETILDNAVDTYEQIYSEFYDALNDFLVDHGYPPIGFIKYYAPHFQKKDVQESFLTAIAELAAGKHVEAVSLPASIAGRTADFKPNKRWNPHMLTRKGLLTDFDIEYGFNRYLDFATDILFHMDDIMRLRSTEQWFREIGSSDHVKAEIKEAKAVRAQGAAEKAAFLADKGAISPGDHLSEQSLNTAMERYISDIFEHKATADASTEYSEFTTWLQNAANLLAGKQSLADRGLEFSGGREALNFAGKLRTSFAAANIAGNIGSILNQTAQIPMLQTELGPYLERAAWDLAQGNLAKEGFVDQSDFLTEKVGTNPLAAELEDHNKVLDALFAPAGMMDLFVSKLAVRGRYLQAIDEGMTHEAALREANDFGRRVMGSRGVGDMPQAFHSKQWLSKLIHSFQLEASNTFDHLISDLPGQLKKIARTDGKAAAKKKAVGLATMYFVNAAVFNGIMGALYGGTPAPFDVIGWALEAIGAGWDESVREFIADLVDGGLKDEGEPDASFDRGKALQSLTGNALNDIPYVQNVGSAMGWNDEDLPQASIGSALTSGVDALKTAAEQTFGGQPETGMSWGEAGRRIADDTVDFASQFLPGGRQAKKTWQGVSAMAKGGKFSGYGDEQRVQFTVDQTPGKWAKAALFGINSLPEAKQYYASGDAAISAKMTGDLQRLDELHGIPFADSAAMAREFRAIDEGYPGEEQSAARAQAKRDAVAEMNLDDYDKIRVFCRLQGKSGATEAKYRALADKGLSWAQISEAAGIYEAAAKNEALSAVERARKLEAWMDEEGLNIGQRRVVSDLFPGAAAKGDDRYDYLADRLESGVPDAVVLSALTTNQWEAYHDYVKPAKIPAVVYADALGFINSEAAKADKDKNGKTITGSKQKKVKRYIKALRLTDKQKIALWEALGYKASSWAE